MVFKGEVFSVGELLRRAQGPAAPIAAEVGVRHTAAESAARVAGLLAAGESLMVGWRFGILQTLDDYRSTLRRARWSWTLRTRPWPTTWQSRTVGRLVHGSWSRHAPLTVLPGSRRRRSCSATRPCGRALVRSGRAAS